MLKQFLEAGKIVNSHGVRGEVVLEPWADSAEFLKKAKRLWFQKGEKDAELLASRVHKGRLLLTLKGVDTKEKADALRGTVMYVSRDDLKLPKGKYFLEDIIGLKAFDGETGREYGEVTDIIGGTGANDVYVIRNDAGKEYLFPAVAHMIKSVDVEGGVMELLPIQGIFDEEFITDKGGETK